MPKGKRNEAARDAANHHSTLNTFAAVVILLEGSLTYDTESDATAAKIIKLCKEETRRQLHKMDAAFARADGVGVPAPWSVTVQYSQGERALSAGMRWRDRLHGGTWEVIEPANGRIYSPSGFGGTPTFWCRPVGDLPESARGYLTSARPDGCVEFCGDSIAASLIGTDGVGGIGHQTFSRNTPMPAASATGKEGGGA
jgi:hypothetical protein